MDDEVLDSPPREIEDFPNRTSNAGRTRNPSDRMAADKPPFPAKSSRTPRARGPSAIRRTYPRCGRSARGGATRVPGNRGWAGSTTLREPLEPPSLSVFLGSKERDPASATFLQLSMCPPRHRMKQANLYAADMRQILRSGAERYLPLSIDHRATMLFPMYR